MDNASNRHVAAGATPPLPCTTQLLNLNDDCLLEIAGYWSSHDLIRFASTCTRLQDIARRTYALHPDHNQLTIKCNSELQCLESETIFEAGPRMRYDLSKSVSDSGLIAFNDRMALYLMHFGHLIQKLHFESYIYISNRPKNYRKYLINYTLFDELLIWCDAEQLTSVTLVNAHWLSDLAPRTYSFFERLDEIVFRDCLDVDLVLSKCINITALEMTLSSNDNAIENYLTVHLPRLTKVTLHCVPSEVGPSLEAFIVRHPQIEEIDIHLANFNLAVLHGLGELKKVKLGIDTGADYIESTSQNAEFANHQIIEFDVNCSGESAAAAWKFIQKLSMGQSRDTLQILRISGDRSAINQNTTNVIKRFEKLQKFHYSCSDGFGMQSLQNLPELMELTLEHAVVPTLDQNAFQSLKVLQISVAALTDDIIRGLARIQTLEELTLRTQMVFVSEQGWPTLGTITGLTKLQLDRMESFATNEFLWNLGSTRTLKTLHLIDSIQRIDDEFSNSLCRFTELETLGLVSDHVRSDSLYMVPRLRKLHTIEISSHAIYWLQREGLRHLQCIKVHRMREFTDEHMIKLRKSAPRLRELHLFGHSADNPPMDLSWPELMLLINNLAELNMLAIGFEVQAMPRKTYAEIAAMCFHQNRKLTIVFSCSKSGQSKTEYENVKHSEFVTLKWN